MQARAAGRWQAQVGVGGQSCVVGSRRAELRQPECLDAKPTMGAGCLGAGLIGHPAGPFMLAKEEARASPAGAPCCHTSKDHLLMSSSTLTWRMVPWRLEHWLTSGSRASDARPWLARGSASRAARASATAIARLVGHASYTVTPFLLSPLFLMDGCYAHCLIRLVLVPRSRRLMQCLRRINDS